MRQFFYPSALAVFGVSSAPGNLAKNIVNNCLEMGFEGKIYPVGKNPGTVFGRGIITEPMTLPDGIDLAVILVPSSSVATTIETCGLKGIRHAIVSTAGFSEFKETDNQEENDLLKMAKKHRIRIIGPNCVGTINTGSGLCTPFNLQPMAFWCRADSARAALKTIAALKNTPGKTGFRILASLCACRLR